MALLQHRYRSVSEWYRCLIRMWVRGCLQRCLGGLASPAPSLLSAEHSITAEVQLRVCRPMSGLFNCRSLQPHIVPQCQKSCSAVSGAETEHRSRDTFKFINYTSNDSIVINAQYNKTACLQKQSSFKVTLAQSLSASFSSNKGGTDGDGVELRHMAVSQQTKKAKRPASRHICSLYPAEVNERARAEADIKILQSDAIQ